jgi:hypothetical protein
LREAAVERPRGGVRVRQAKVAPAKRSLLWICVDPPARLFRAHPGKTLAATACVALMAGIAGNAVLLQKGRHPAPLFGSAPTGSVRSTAPGPMPPPRPRPAPADAVPAAPVSPPPSTVDTRAADAAPAAAAGSVTPTPRRAARKTERRGPVPTPHPSASKLDGITRLLEGKSATLGRGPKDTPVVAAQKALGRLGYAIKPDGLMGKATREALTKFEQGRHLGGDGTLSPTLLRTLEHAAGSPRG